MILAVVIFVLFTATGCMATSHSGHSTGMAQHSSGCH